MEVFERERFDWQREALKEKKSYQGAQQWLAGSLPWDHGSLGVDFEEHCVACY